MKLDDLGLCHGTASSADEKLRLPLLLGLELQAAASPMPAKRPARKPGRSSEQRGHAAAMQHQTFLNCPFPCCKLKAIKATKRKMPVAGHVRRYHSARMNDMLERQHSSREAYASEAAACKA